MNEPELIEKARAGDREAFAELYVPVERPLAAFLYRLTAIRSDAEDLAQETALRALETINQCAGTCSFRAWIFRIGVRAALEYLEGRKAWDPDAQIRAGRRAADDAAARRRWQKLHGSALHTTYDIREHIDFCFTCMGRTVPPREQAALLLAEVHGFSAEEAADVLDVSPQALQLQADRARSTLVEHYESRCALINSKGSCLQCAGFHTLLYGDHRSTEQALFQVELQVRPTPQDRAATFDQRLGIVRSIDPLHADGARLHDSLMTFTRQVSHY